MTAATRLPVRSLVGAVVVAALLCVALFGDRYAASVLVYIAVYGILASSLGLVVGFAGQISLGHAAFFALGAYGTGILTATAGWWSIPAMAVGIAVCAVVGFVLGFVLLRLSGYYLAMGTLAFNSVVTVLLVSMAGLTGGGTGLAGIPPLDLFGWQVGDVSTFAVIAVLAATAVVVSNALIHDSAAGGALFAVHDDEAMAATVGIDVARVKRAAFTLAAAQAGIAGGLFAHHLRFLAPSDFSVIASVTLVVMVLIGGGARPWGPVLGATVLTLLPEFITEFEDYSLLITGGLLIVVLVFLPKGLVSLPDLVVPRKRRAGASS
ncbi:branched-chain amino acid ABC transporter permease [Modestobacter lapidis]|nr:branched-chain amino acid ABC transporter permease [Modestobacter lapidis]